MVGTINNRRVAVGTPDWLRQNGMKLPPGVPVGQEEEDTGVSGQIKILVGIDNRAVASLSMLDQVRAGKHNRKEISLPPS